MGFVKDLAMPATFGLAGLLASHKNKKAPVLQPTMISSVSRPTSMIGSTRSSY